MISQKAEEWLIEEFGIKIEYLHRYPSWFQCTIIMWAISKNHISIAKYIIENQWIGYYDINLLLQGCLSWMNSETKYSFIEGIRLLLSYHFILSYEETTLPLLKRAVGRGHKESFELIFYDKRVYYSFDKRDEIVSICENFDYLKAMVLYDPFTPKDKGYKKYHEDLKTKLARVLFEVAVAMYWLPTPLIIEIVEGLVEWAYFMPYHVKWNMVCAVKHSRFNITPSYHNLQT